ncbi:hypothetical protein P186_2871 [Pyrobaculum ferrireducens]|uniref:Uncharacterized protein n=2 Tax=Pyrobaculum ferrireducens TaxID=1104324 RepID=G7VFP1_9CREN|nr:hypothetical protein P186_2871 [Pyrobaculum ferrireducens]
MEMRSRVEYKVAWMLYTLGVRGLARLPDLKKLFAKAMAAKWCSRKDRRFCEEAFYRLYSYDIAKYLPHRDPVLLLSLALYDVERGDHNLTALKEYVERGALPAEFALLSGVEKMEHMFQIVAGLLKTLGEATPDLIAVAWQVTARRLKTVPVIEKVRENVVLQALLVEMEKRGYVKREGPRYMLTEGGEALALEIKIPPEVVRLKEMKYVTPHFYALLNAGIET